MSLQGIRDVATTLLAVALARGSVPRSGLLVSLVVLLAASTGVVAQESTPAKDVLLPQLFDRYAIEPSEPLRQEILAHWDDLSKEVREAEAEVEQELSGSAYTPAIDRLVTLNYLESEVEFRWSRLGEIKARGTLHTVCTCEPPEEDCCDHLTFVRSNSGAAFLVDMIETSQDNQATLLTLNRAGIAPTLMLKPTGAVAGTLGRPVRVTTVIPTAPATGVIRTSGKELRLFSEWHQNDEIETVTPQLRNRLSRVANTDVEVTLEIFSGTNKVVATKVNPPTRYTGTLLKRWDDHLVLSVVESRTQDPVHLTIRPGSDQEFSQHLQGLVSQKVDLEAYRVADNIAVVGIKSPLSPVGGMNSAVGGLEKE